EVSPFEQLHHEERHAVVRRARVEDSRDVLAPKPRGGAPFAHEALRDVRIERGFGAKEFERDLRTEGEVPRSDHDTPAAATDHVADLVFSRDALPLAHRIAAGVRRTRDARGTERAVRHSLSSPERSRRANGDPG